MLAGGWLVSVWRRATRLQAMKLRKNSPDNKVGIALLCLQPVDYRFGLLLPCHCLREQGVKPEDLRRATRLQASKLRKNISQNKVGITLLCLHPVDNRLPGLLPRPQFIKRRMESFHCR